jgi:hypothetical protein
MLPTGRPDAASNDHRSQSDMGCRCVTIGPLAASQTGCGPMNRLEEPAISRR